MVNAWVLASCYSIGIEGIGTKFAMGDKTVFPACQSVVLCLEMVPIRVQESAVM